jgi:tRNA pseudouridine38-40 synthase
MRNIKLTIQFDGTAYNGWQIQKNGKGVQQIVQDALSIILNSSIKLHGSGRTDAGVHALGQVAHFATDSDMALHNLQKGINSLLPEDIVVKKVEEAATDFHSRFRAVSRVYWYLIWNLPEKSPFYSKYSWHIIKPLDVTSMRSASKHLIGVHDFLSFKGSDKQEVNTVREIKNVRLRKTRNNLIIVEIEATAFLRHMVRAIIGTLAEVGRGNITPEKFKEIIEKRDRRFAGETAPAKGLFLKGIKY